LNTNERNIWITSTTTPTREKNKNKNKQKRKRKTASYEEMNRWSKSLGTVKLYGAMAHTILVFGTKGRLCPTRSSEQRVVFIQQGLFGRRRRRRVVFVEKARKKK